MTTNVTIQQMKANPATSFWLRKAIDELCQRDPLDALNDAAALQSVMLVRANEATLETATEPKYAPQAFPRGRWS